MSDYSAYRAPRSQHADHPDLQRLQAAPVALQCRADRRVGAHLEVAMRNHGSPQVGQPGRAHPVRFPAPQKNGPAVGVTVMSHPRLRSCLSSSAGSCGTFTIR